MLKSNNVIYKFDFGNKIKKFFSILFEVFGVINFIAWLAFFDFVLLVIINESIQNKIIEYILILIISIPAVIFVFYLLILLFLPKKIVLTDVMILVKRNTLPAYRINHGFNDYIIYSNIECCDYCENHSRRGKDIHFAFVNWDSMVMIKDKFNRKYYIPVKNAEDFINDVTERVNEYRRKNGLEEI